MGDDGDLGEIRAELRDFRKATVTSFKAVRGDMLDMRGEMRAKFDVTGAGQRQIVGMLETLIDRESR